MDAAAQGFSDLGIDLPAETGQAAERRLDVPAGAAEPVVEIEVPESGVEIVAPHQAHHTAAEPDTFRVAGRAVNDLGGLDEFVGLALVVLGGVGRIGGRGFAGLVGGGGATLGENAARSDQEGEACDGDMAQNRTFWIKHPSTHTFPDMVPARETILDGPWPSLMPSKWVPNAAETYAIPMTVISDFVQQSHNFIAAW